MLMYEICSAVCEENVEEYRELLYHSLIMTTGKPAELN